MRNGVVLAKELATVDALSGGRLIAGLGVGWSPEEFANVFVTNGFITGSALRSVALSG